MKKNSIIYTILPNSIALVLSSALIAKTYFGNYSNDETTLSPIVVAITSMFFYEWYFWLLGGAYNENKRPPHAAFLTFFYGLAAGLTYAYVRQPTMALYNFSYITFLLILLKNTAQSMYFKELPILSFLATLVIVCLTMLSYRVDWAPLALLIVHFFEAAVSQLRGKISQKYLVNTLSYINIFSFLFFIWVQLFSQRTPNNQLFVIILGVLLTASFIYSAYRKMAK